VTNEGNEQLVIGLASVVICVAGVEKVVRGAEWALEQATMQAFSSAGRPSSFVTVYGPWITREGKEFHLVLVDNGRLEALKDPVMREGLRCIRCAACYNVCPTYRTVGGHVFGGIYSGPIGVFWEAVASGPDSANRFSDFCISCGLCALECPVGIRIPLLISHVKSMRRGLRLRGQGRRPRLRALRSPRVEVAAARELARKEQGLQEGPRAGRRDRRFQAPTTLQGRKAPRLPARGRGLQPGP
jgi:Uncharacterized conserved protein containing a ferredoxin-like domain